MGAPPPAGWITSPSGMAWLDPSTVTAIAISSRPETWHVDVVAIVLIGWSTHDTFAEAETERARILSYDSRLPASLRGKVPPSWMWERTPPDPDWQKRPDSPFVQAIREQMAASDLKTKTALANHLGVAQSTVSRWLRGSVPSEGAERLREWLDMDEETFGRLLFASRR